MAIGIVAAPIKPHGRLMVLRFFLKFLSCGLDRSQRLKFATRIGKWEK